MDELKANTSGGQTNMQVHLASDLGLSTLWITNDDKMFV